MRGGRSAQPLAAPAGSWIDSPATFRSVSSLIASAAGSPLTLRSEPGSSDAIEERMDTQRLDVATHPDFDLHEEVVECRDASSGLHAIVAIHDSSRGPALGGCRMWPYPDRDAALRDVLRLATGMTYKSALAGLPLGGGKAVILGSPREQKSRELLLAMGAFVDALGGRYIIAEDSGTRVDDMRVIRERTRFVSGISDTDQHGGDPSPATAYGTFLGIREAVRARLGRPELSGVRVAIQGVGNVGFHLAGHLKQAGAVVLVSDLSNERLDRAVERHGVRVVPAASVHAADVEVFSPCALGGAIGDATLPELRAPIVAGAANNQLATPAHGIALHERRILYAPDYAINAGGIIDIACRYAGDSDEQRLARIERIPETLAAIFRSAEADDRPTFLVADALAEQRLARHRTPT